MNDFNEFLRNFQEVYFPLRNNVSPVEAAFLDLHPEVFLGIFGSDFKVAWNVTTPLTI